MVSYTAKQDGTVKHFIANQRTRNLISKLSRRFLKAKETPESQLWGRQQYAVSWEADFKISAVVLSAAVIQQKANPIHWIHFPWSMSRNLGPAAQGVIWSKQVGVGRRCGFLHLNCTKCNKNPYPQTGDFVLPVCRVQVWDPSVMLPHKPFPTHFCSLHHCLGWVVWLPLTSHMQITWKKMHPSLNKWINANKF